MREAPSMLLNCCGDVISIVLLILALAVSRSSRLKKVLGFWGSSVELGRVCL
jgi:hypothetical protein